MLKKAITTILLMCVLLLMACRGGENEKGESASEEMAESTTYMEAETLEESEPEELTGELRIMTWLPSNNLQYVIEDFMQEHPGVTVTVETNQVEKVASAEYMEKYTTRIMTGEGFDIIESGLVNMEKCVRQGLFADLYELMNADMDFHREDYFSCIFERAEVDGELPAFIYNVKPIYFHLNKKLLAKAGIEYTKDTINFQELYDIYEKVREAAGERIFLTDAGYGYEGMSDYENGYFIRNNLIDTDEFEEYLRMRHKLYSTVENRVPWIDGTMKIESDVLCCQSELKLPGNSVGDTDINDMFTGTEDMTAYESMHGERYPSAMAALSISSFSENKELAWEFIKYVFSDKDTSLNHSSLFSPNKGKMEKVSEELTPENREKLFRDIEAINTFKYADSNLYYNLESVYEDYLVNDSITSEECRKELASRVYLYMNE